MHGSLGLCRSIGLQVSGLRVFFGFAWCLKGALLFLLVLLLFYIYIYIYIYFFFFLGGGLGVPKP